MPFGLKHYLDYRKCFWKIGGASRKRLQVLLMRKFFNYTEDSRKKVKVEALVMGMTRDVNDIVTNAYVARYARRCRRRTHLPASCLLDYVGSHIFDCQDASSTCSSFLRQPSPV